MSENFVPTKREMPDAPLEAELPQGYHPTSEPHPGIIMAVGELHQHFNSESDGSVPLRHLAGADTIHVRPGDLEAFWDYARHLGLNAKNFTSERAA